VRLKWTRPASRDLDQVEEYIRRDNPTAAIRTVRKIIRQVGILGRHPGLGRPGRVEGTRELLISGLPYVVPYIHQGDAVIVLRVLHSAIKWPETF
jgi:toxin ParE1/3/4